jgi:hypothetical protein
LDNITHSLVGAALSEIAVRESATPTQRRLFLAAVLVPALRFDLALWTDPARAPLPALDRFQYVTGWPSGYGARDSIAFLRAERACNPAGLLLVTPGPSTTASAVRLLWANDRAWRCATCRPNPSTTRPRSARSRPAAPSS